MKNNVDFSKYTISSLIPMELKKIWNEYIEFKEPLIQKRNKEYFISTNKIDHKTYLINISVLDLSCKCDGYNIVFNAYK